MKFSPHKKGLKTKNTCPCMWVNKTRYGFLEKKHIQIYVEDSQLVMGKLALIAKKL